MRHVRNPKSLLVVGAFVSLLATVPADDISTESMLLVLAVALAPAAYVVHRGVARKG